MSPHSKAVLSITLSLLAVLAVLACPLWVAAHSSQHNCFHRNAPDRCPMTICEVSGPYLTEGKFETPAVSAMDFGEIVAVPMIAPPTEQGPVHLSLLPASPPDVSVRLHILRI